MLGKSDVTRLLLLHGWSKSRFIIIIIIIIIIIMIIIIIEFSFAAPFAQFMDLPIVVNTVLHIL